MVSIPLPEVLNMQRVCFDTMLAAFSGDVKAREEVEAVFAIALNPQMDPKTRGQATISCYLLVDACDQIAVAKGFKSTAQEQATRNATTNTEGMEQATVNVNVGCTHPLDVPCDKCGSGQE